jgi:tetratricopeptide (TPR) repeat protein
MRTMSPVLVILSLTLAAQEPDLEINNHASRLLAEGRLEEALTEFRRAGTLSPGDPQIKFNIGLTLIRLSRLSEAIAPLRDASADPRLAPDARYLLGLAHFQLRQWQLCADALDSLRNHAKHAESSLYMLVESYRHLLRAQDSQRAFVQLTTRFPDSAFGHKLLGMAYDARGDTQKALHHFTAALAGDQQLPDVRFAIGYIHFRQQDFKEASRWLEAELKLQPCHARANYYLGEIARKRAEPKAAQGLYREALRCDPDYAEPYLGLGTVLEQEGRVSEALPLLTEYVRRSPNEAGGRYRLARVLQKAGRTAEAQAEFRRASELRAEHNRKTTQKLGTASPDN